MGKHKNIAQEAIFIKFMENHKDLAKGFMKGDRVVADALWNELKNDLNSHGPLQKDVTGWKKVWTDWKASIRKKLAQNKAEDISTGGGPFNKFVISPTEDTIAKISGIYTVVQGVPDTRDFGLEEIETDEHDSSSSKFQEVLQEVREPANATNRKKKIQASMNDNLNDFMLKQNQTIEKIGETMEGILTALIKHARAGKEIDHSIRKLQKSVDNIQSILEAKNEEALRHNYEREKCRQEEIQLKKREVELKEIKLDIYKSQM